MTAIPKCKSCGLNRLMCECLSTEWVDEHGRRHTVRSGSAHRDKHLETCAAMGCPHDVILEAKRRMDNDDTWTTERKGQLFPAGAPEPAQVAASVAATRQLLALDGRASPTVIVLRRDVEVLLAAADAKEKGSQIAGLIMETSALQKDRDKWKAAHDEMAKRNALLRDRTDLPTERTESYARICKERDGNVAFAQAERDEWKGRHDGIVAEMARLQTLLLKRLQ